MTDPGVSRQATPPRLWTLHIARDSRAGVPILSIAGRLGAASSRLLAETLQQELRSGHARLLVDLDRVDYISSAGLRVLQEAVARARECGVRLALCSLSEPVRLAFDLSGLMEEFTIEPSLEAGVAGLQPEPP
jgi:anti-anti-sigma factor